LINVIRVTHRKEITMLRNSLSLFLSSRQKDGSRQSGETSAVAEFPQGQLTSTAWEGWWHNPAQA
jgi:hypothetical protein